MAVTFGLGLAVLSFLFVAWSLRAPASLGSARFAHDFDLLRAEQSALEAQIQSGQLPKADALRMRSELRRRVLHLHRLSKGAGDLQDTPVPAAIGLLLIVLAVFSGFFVLHLSGQERGESIGSFKSAPQRGELPGNADFEVLMTEGQARYAAGNPAGAFDAYEAASQLAPGRVEGWLGQGEALVAASNGEVAPAAMLAFAKAEQISPDNPVSLYYSGLERLQQGDAAAAQAIWQSLKDRSLPTAPWMAQLDRGLAAAAQALGKAPEPQIGLAEIEAMVAGLAARLEDEPNDPEGWLMLARSYLVLERPQDAAAALAQVETMSVISTTVAQQARALRERLAK